MVILSRITGFATRVILDFQSTSPFSKKKKKKKIDRDRKSLKQQTPTRKSRRARSSSSESSQRERTPPRSRTPSDRSRKQTPVSEACRSGTPPMADGRPVLPYVRAGVTHLRVLRIDSPFYDQQDASESPTPASMQ